MEERLLALLRLALKNHGTDIHFTVRNCESTIEMRIDGVCRRVKSKFEDYKLIRYLQYLSNLDVGNLLQPQTGQFEMEVDGNLLSLRFAIVNRLDQSYGVLRILNNNLAINADNLSHLDKQNLYFKSLMQKNCGLILFSGPTGSGKTTTVYSLLKSVSKRKIYTIEDPIEIYNDNIIQLQVNEEIGFDYKKGVEQILRHDPDIIMIGEIRDDKAAKIAVVAANTGHLVVSTIHSSRASSCISRMIDLGVNQDHLYENLLCICHQRMLINKNNKEKVVLYEVMDKKEITYFYKYHTNSKNFLSVDSQIIWGIKNGIFEKNSL